MTSFLASQQIAGEQTRRNGNTADAGRGLGVKLLNALVRIHGVMAMPVLGGYQQQSHQQGCAA